MATKNTGLGNFDYVTIGTRIADRDNPAQVYSVSDFRDGKEGVTVLVLTPLDENGYGRIEIRNGVKVAARKKHLRDTPVNRARWVRV